MMAALEYTENNFGESYDLYKKRGKITLDDVRAWARWFYGDDYPLLIQTAGYYIELPESYSDTVRVWDGGLVNATVELRELREQNRKLRNDIGDLRRELAKQQEARK